MTTPTPRPLDIEGAFLIEHPVHQDERGFFRECFRESAGLPGIKQINYSASNYGVLRGLHFQRRNPQGKYLWVVQGEIRDAIVDLRHSSPTFKKAIWIDLNAMDGLTLYVPPGCAHGFSVESKMAVVAYGCTEERDEGSEDGIDPYDHELQIEWPQGRQYIMSLRDRSHQGLSKYLAMNGIFS